jgi:hypothetical protein
MRGNFLVRSLWLGATSLSLLAGAAPSSADSLKDMLACRDVPQADERLQCYDAAAHNAAKTPTPVAVTTNTGTVAAGGFGQNVSSREADLAAREAALKEREARLAKPVETAEEEATLFGIPIPFTKKDRFNQVTELPNQTIERDENGVVEAMTVNVREFTVGGDDRLTLVLENGQVWRQIEGDSIQLSSKPSKPHVARITRGALGSFNLQLNKMNRAVKVRRIDGPQGKR